MTMVAVKLFERPRLAITLASSESRPIVAKKMFTTKENVRKNKSFKKYLPNPAKRLCRLLGPVMPAAARRFLPQLWLLQCLSTNFAPSH
jgi:hypothetical protein